MNRALTSTAVNNGGRSRLPKKADPPIEPRGPGPAVATHVVRKHAGPRASPSSSSSTHGPKRIGNTYEEPAWPEAFRPDQEEEALLGDDQQRPMDEFDAPSDAHFVDGTPVKDAKGRILHFELNRKMASLLRGMRTCGQVLGVLMALLTLATIGSYVLIFTLDRGGGDTTVTNVFNNGTGGGVNGTNGADGAEGATGVPGPAGPIGPGGEAGASNLTIKVDGLPLTTSPISCIDFTSGPELQVNLTGPGAISVAHFPQADNDTHGHTASQVVLFNETVCDIGDAKWAPLAHNHTVGNIDNFTAIVIELVINNAPNIYNTDGATTQPGVSTSPRRVNIDTLEGFIIETDPDGFPAYEYLCIDQTEAAVTLKGPLNTNIGEPGETTTRIRGNIEIPDYDDATHVVTSFDYVLVNEGDKLRQINFTEQVCLVTETDCGIGDHTHTHDHISDFNTTVCMIGDAKYAPIIHTHVTGDILNFTAEVVELVLLNEINIYKDDGTLTGPRTLSTGGFDLTFITPSTSSIVLMDTMASIVGTSMTVVGSMAGTSKIRGDVRFDEYGDGSHASGMIAFLLGVTPSGDVIEIPLNATTETFNLTISMDTNDTSIYVGDGTLIAERIVYQDGNGLSFSDGTERLRFSGVNGVSNPGVSSAITGAGFTGGQGYLLEAPVDGHFILKIDSNDTDDALIILDDMNMVLYSFQHGGQARFHGYTSGPLAFPGTQASYAAFDAAGNIIQVPISTVEDDTDTTLYSADGAIPPATTRTATIGTGSTLALTDGAGTALTLSEATGAASLAGASSTTLGTTSTPTTVNGDIVLGDYGDTSHVTSSFDYLMVSDGTDLKQTNATEMVCTIADVKYSMLGHTHSPGDINFLNETINELITLNEINVYKDDGTLTGDRTLDLGGNTLSLTDGSGTELVLSDATNTATLSGASVTVAGSGDTTIGTASTPTTVNGDIVLGDYGDTSHVTSSFDYLMVSDGTDLKQTNATEMVCTIADAKYASIGHTHTPVDILGFNETVLDLVGERDVQVAEQIATIQAFAVCATATFDAHHDEGMLRPTSSFDFDAGSGVFADNGDAKDAPDFVHWGPVGTFPVRLGVSTDEDVDTTLAIYEFTLTHMNNPTQPQTGVNIGTLNVPARVGAAVTYRFMEFNVTTTTSPAWWVFVNDSDDMARKVHVKSMASFCLTS